MLFSLGVSFFHSELHPLGFWQVKVDSADAKLFPEESKVLKIKLIIQSGPHSERVPVRKYKHMIQDLKVKEDRKDSCITKILRLQHQK